MPLYKPQLSGATDPIGWGMPTTHLNMGGRSNTIAFGVNDYILLRVIGGGTITKIAIEVAAQSGNICVGVYRNTGVGFASAPGARAATSGSVACPGTGVQQIALGASVVVNSGDWFALACDNATARFMSTAQGGNADILAPISRYVSGGAFPLPDPAAAGVGSSYNLPIMVGVT